MLVAVVVFMGVFLVAALLLVASGSGASEREKQTLARLDSVLAVDIVKSKDQLVDVRKTELLSSIPLLNRILLSFQIAPKLRQFLYQSNVRLTPGGFLLITLSLWVFASYLLFLRTEVVSISLLLALIPAAAPLAYVSHMRTRRFQKFEEGLPPALELMVNGLRSGHSLVAAIGLVGREAQDPIGREFQICFDEQNYGLELRTVMDNLASRIPIQDIKMIKTAILIQKETGGNLAEVLDKCAYVIRERFRLKKEIRIKTAQGRLTGWILSFLPVALGIMLFIVNPEGISLLWQRELGRSMLYGSAIMTLIGALIIRKIVRIQV